MLIKSISHNLWITEQDYQQLLIAEILFQNNHTVMSLVDFVTQDGPIFIKYSKTNICGHKSETM